MNEFDLHHIRDATESLSESVSDISSSQRLAAEALAKAARKRPYVDIDALTTAEVEELSRLIAEDSPRGTAERISTDMGLVGMYDELARLGLVDAHNGMDGKPGVVFVTPLGVWAVEKRHQRDAEALAGREHQWAHDRKMTWIAAIAGLIGAMIGAVISRI